MTKTLYITSISHTNLSPLKDHSENDNSNLSLKEHHNLSCNCIKCLQECVL